MRTRPPSGSIRNPNQRRRAIDPIHAPRAGIGAKSLAALHTTVGLLVVAAVCCAGLLVFPEARGVVAEHFELLRGAVYGMWALGLLAFLLAPLMLARDLGSRV